MAVKEPSQATLDLIQEYAKKSAIDIEETTIVLKSLASMRDQLELLYGLSKSLLTPEGGMNTLLTADNFIRGVSGLGDFSVGDLRAVTDRIYDAYARLLEIPYGRSEGQENEILGSTLKIKEGRLSHEGYAETRGLVRIGITETNATTVPHRPEAAARYGGGDEAGPG